MSGSAQIIRADARHLPIADGSVDLVITSPPYYSLRSYTDGGEHYDGQIGDEATPAEFLDALLEVTRECVRVLKPSGSLWVNLGDKYVADNRGSGGDTKRGDAKHAPAGPAGYVGNGIMPRKSLMCLPERYRIRCIDELGLILRAVVVWDKPNGLPESVTDRVRRSHEEWMHFTVQPRYYSAVDEIRETYDTADRKGERTSYRPGQTSGNTLNGHLRKSDAGLPLNPLGKLPGSVWRIPTEPITIPEHLGVDHFAAFPTEWPRRIIQGWSPAGVCVECGEGRRPVSRTDETSRVGGNQRNGRRDSQGSSHAIDATWSFKVRTTTTTTITGYACACPEPTAPTTPGVVLDVFGGTGTTALVAKALGRHGISVDMSADYCRLAEWRTNDPKELAKAARRPFVASAPPIDGQADLLDLIASSEGETA